MRRYYVYGIALILLAGGGYWGWSRYRDTLSALTWPQVNFSINWSFFRNPQAAAPGGPPGVPVEAATVRVGTIADEITAIGSLRSNESVTLRPEIAGRVVRVNFREGQPVTEGQLLIELDDSVPRAELADAQAQLTVARANSERSIDLFARGAGSARARDEAVATLRMAEAAVELRRARLAQYRLMAPFDGVAGLRQVSPGDFVAAGAAIVNIESLNPIKVEFRVPELYLPSVHSGQILRLRVDAYPGKEFPGAVYAINPALDASGRSIAIRAMLPNTDNQLRPGLFARVTLTLRQEERAIMVPESAVVPMQQGAIVMKIVDGRAVAQPVRLGIRRNTEVQIVEGLSEGDVVVTAGHMKLQPGAPVMVVNQPPPAAAPTGAGG